MKYVLRTLWVIGYIPVFIFIGICLLISLVIMPLLAAFYFIKTGSWENCPFTPDSLPAYIDRKYEELLKYL